MDGLLVICQNLLLEYGLEQRTDKSTLTQQQWVVAHTAEDSVVASVAASEVASEAVCPEEVAQEVDFSIVDAFLLRSVVEEINKGINT